MATTANGLTATAVRGVPNTWIVRTSSRSYDAIETDGTPISEVDTSVLLLPGDHRWNTPGTLHRTVVRDYDTAEEGRCLAGWHVEFRHNTAGPYQHAVDALGALKTLLRDFHNARRA